MAIKKPYEDLIRFLESKKASKVSDILAEVKDMCESKKQVQTFIKDADGKVVAIYCYYHKQWELLKEVPYGSKKNSTTGFNTMCKVGVSCWTKAQSEAAKKKDAILKGVASGSIKNSDLLKLLDEVEVERNTINKKDMPKGYVDETAVNKALGSK